MSPALERPGQDQIRVRIRRKQIPARNGGSSQQGSAQPSRRGCHRSHRGQDRTQTSANQKLVCWAIDAMIGQSPNGRRPSLVFPEGSNRIWNRRMQAAGRMKVRARMLNDYARSAGPGWLNLTDRRRPGRCFSGIRARAKVAQGSGWQNGHWGGE